MTPLESRLEQALHAAGAEVEPSADLFDRIQVGIGRDRARRRTQRRLECTPKTFCLMISS